MLHRYFRQSSWLLITLIYIVTLGLLGITQANAADTSEPKVPFIYAVGFQKFQHNCSVCHGKWGEGSKQGPPLMHQFYVPSHHSDESFYRAALQGVKAHHWNFGDMPRVSGVTEKDMDAIVPYIRWLQREKGIIR